MPQPDPAAMQLADLVHVQGGAQPDIAMLETEAPLPWAGHTSRYALAEIFAAIKAHHLSLVFVNTRSQAELLFQELWRINDDNLPIALHHGSLDAARRRKVEAAMAAGTLKAVVATSTLDLGIDWGDVDLVINVGAPKGASRLIQRVGRANHRLDEPSRAVLVPANRFEVLECRAAIDAAAGRRPGCRAEPQRRARRAGPARVGHGLRRPVPAGRPLPRGALGRALRRPDARPVRPHRRLRLHRRLRAARLRTLRAPQADCRTAACASPIRASPSSTA